MTRDQQLNIIYRHTHRDFKGKWQGDRTILVLREKGTSIVALKDMTDTEIASRIGSAMNKETERKARKAA